MGSHLFSLWSQLLQQSRLSFLSCHRQGLHRENSMVWLLWYLIPEMACHQFYCNLTVKAIALSDSKHEMQGKKTLFFLLLSYVLWWGPCFLDWLTDLLHKCYMTQEISKKGLNLSIFTVGLTKKWKVMGKCVRMKEYEPRIINWRKLSKSYLFGFRSASLHLQSQVWFFPMCRSHKRVLWPASFRGEGKDR